MAQQKLVLVIDAREDLSRSNLNELIGLMRHKKLNGVDFIATSLFVLSDNDDVVQELRSSSDILFLVGAPQPMAKLSEAIKDRRTVFEKNNDESQAPSLK